MNKSELIDVIAKHAGVTKAHAGRVLDALTETTRASLKKDGTVAVTGLGTFSVVKSAGQPGRGGAARIPSKSVKFRPSKVLRDAVIK